MTYNRYDNGKIYQITNNIDDMVYVGSTCLPLRKRLYNHKKEHHSGKGPNRRLFLHAKQHGWSEFNIILVELYPMRQQRPAASARGVPPQADPARDLSEHVQGLPLAGGQEADGHAEQVAVHAAVQRVSAPVLAA
eukprot:COSAG04_NODE_12246_length_662_cov_106.149201_1_plen_135_part_00